MNIDPKEMAELASVPAAPREDLYSGIHKALRALMADTLLGLGRMDTEDDFELAQTCHRVMELLDFCRAHLTHENQFIHAAIEARAPGASEVIAHEHEEHERGITELGSAVTALLTAPRAGRAAAALGLYRQLALFIAHNFEHMHVEETAHNAVLWSRYTDAELIAIHNALVASIPPEEMMYVMRWMVPFMNPSERAAMLGDVQRHAPPQAFQAALEVARPHLTDAEWAKLMRSLGLSPVSGLVRA
ncbi:hemerythrin domain-containing protein [Variovorax terrae]|uniref:Hemerythrin domain-containing protein n=1 Tax=Variovorax terrae TaxID=2923278 RepID=A0A9X1VZB1_9BURK|nr:hemerythrin domain-containing protein [Variovorax terrae]MCJ0764807.1 hemerythrin domain-containing protein [Variovorax terrae]